MLKQQESDGASRKLGSPPNDGIRYHTLEELRGLVDGQCVALVGNSIALIGQGRGAHIDGFPVVARVNRGFPWHHPKDLGTKTTVWANNEIVPVSEVDKLDPKFCIWSAPRNEDPSGNYFYRKLDETGEQGWYFKKRCRGLSMDIPLLHEIHQGIGIKSSSGLRLLMLLYRLCEPAQITLFGFDFLKEKTWYWAAYRDEHSAAHNGGKEEAYVRSLPSLPEIWLMKEDGEGMELLNRGQVTAPSPVSLPQK